MRKHIRSTSLPVFALSLVVLLVSLGTMLPGAPARATEDCVAKPNAAAPAGQHWWYRTDRATKRKCWFLGPTDKEAAARKADQQEQAAASEAEPEAQPASTQSTPPAPVAQRDANGVQSFVFVTQESVPYLVDWSGLLKEAGIVSKDNAVTGWADDNAARSAWAMRDQPDQEPIESQVDKQVDKQAGKDEARAPQTAVADAETAKDPAAAPAGLPVTYIAALLIAGVMGPAIFSIVRTRRRRNSPRRADARGAGVFDGTFPAFLQRQDARSVPSGQQHGQEPDQEYGRAYGGEEELRRILEGVQRRAA